MQFTMPFFLIGLLPWFIVVFILVRSIPKGRKALLLFANVLFYLWGNIGAFLIMLAYCCLVWAFSSLLAKQRNKTLFAVTIVASVLPLIAFKYLGFLIQNFNALFQFDLRGPNWILPLGISFVTFQAVSLLSDIFTRKIKRAPAFLDTILYLTFFATITSGPIMRYTEFEPELKTSHPVIDLGASLEKVMIGLCKKTLIADKLSFLADYYFDGTAQGLVLSGAGLWIGSITFTLQLYFDFSGYCDMAIGIGGLMGFKIPENFNGPYLSKSIVEFWRRWHMTLSRWFRDDVYIPPRRESLPRRTSYSQFTDCLAFNRDLAWLRLCVHRMEARLFPITCRREIPSFYEICRRKMVQPFLRDVFCESPVDSIQNGESGK